MVKQHYSWQDLAGLTLARQFPDVDGRDVAAVTDMVGRIGPIQSQTARSPFLGLAARMPGVDLETISTAYEDLSIVRGSNIRGTIHTSTPGDHALLEAITRVGERSLWARFLKLHAATLEEVWEGIELFAAERWFTPDEVRNHLLEWIEQHDHEANPDLTSVGGRSLAMKHGGLLRRPLVGGWQAQGAPGYRTAVTLLGERTELLSDVDAAMDSMVRRHLSAYGPASRNDIAWWSGVGLRRTDAALGRLSAELTQRPGPDGRTYHDLLDVPAPVDQRGLRLLPEFDALLCGYEPVARGRFISPDQHQRLWSPANGLILAPILNNDRIVGYWRITGSGERRQGEVTWFAGTAGLATSDLDQPMADVETAYGITISDLSVGGEPS